jgi:membrane protein
MGAVAAPLAAVVHWLLTAALAVALLATLYHVAPPRWTPWRRDFPGAVLALVLWVAGAVLVRTYVEWTIASDDTYGPFAAPIVILLWLYFTAFAVLLGAELNAEIERMWPTSGDNPAGRERVTGRRRRARSPKPLSTAFASRPPMPRIKAPARCSSGDDAL